MIKGVNRNFDMDAKIEIVCQIIIIVEIWWIELLLVTLYLK